MNRIPIDPTISLSLFFFGCVCVCVGKFCPSTFPLLMTRFQETENAEESVRKVGGCRFKVITKLILIFVLNCFTDSGRKWHTSWKKDKKKNKKQTRLKVKVCPFGSI